MEAARLWIQTARTSARCLRPANCVLMHTGPKLAQSAIHTPLLQHWSSQQDAGESRWRVSSSCPPPFRASSMLCPCAHVHVCMGRSHWPHPCGPQWFDHVWLAASIPQIRAVVCFFPPLLGHGMLHQIDLLGQLRERRLLAGEMALSVCQCPGGSWSCMRSPRLCFSLQRCGPTRPERRWRASRTPRTESVAREIARVCGRRVGADEGTRTSSC